MIFRRRIPRVISSLLLGSAYGCGGSGGEPADLGMPGDAGMDATILDMGRDLPTMTLGELICSAREGCGSTVPRAQCLTDFSEKYELLDNDYPQACIEAYADYVRCFAAALMNDCSSTPETACPDEDYRYYYDCGL